MRCARVVLAYQDRHGAPQRLEAGGLFAVCIQHELDHLDGKLIVDRTDDASRREALRELRPKIVLG